MTVKERIIEEATTLFFQRGVRNVTMNDLALRLGMSKRTIYENVKDKDELIAECLDYFAKREDSDLPNDKDMPMIDVLKKIIGASKETISSDIGSFMLDVKRYHPKVFEHNVERYQQKRLDKICRFLEKGMSEDFFRQDLDVKVLSKILMSLFTAGMHNLDLDKFDKQQLPQLFCQVFILFCRGMATMKGVKEIDEAFYVTGK